MASCAVVCHLRLEVFKGKLQLNEPTALTQLQKVYQQIHRHLT